MSVTTSAFCGDELLALLYVRYIAWLPIPVKYILVEIFLTWLHEYSYSDNSNSYEIFKSPYFKIQFKLPEGQIDKDYDGKNNMKNKISKRDNS